MERGGNEMQLGTCMEIMKENGYKCTNQRIAIIKYFLQKRNKLISPKRLTKHLRKSLKNISVGTIYRNLSLFSKIGLMGCVYRDGESLFYLKSDEKADQLLLICDECLSTRELSLCLIPLIEPTLLDCTILHYKLEIHGVCPSCITASKNCKISALL